MSDYVEMVACPVCTAEVGENCKTAHGIAHQERIVATMERDAASQNPEIAGLKAIVETAGEDAVGRRLLVADMAREGDLPGGMVDEEFVRDYREIVDHNAEVRLQRALGSRSGIVVRVCSGCRRQSDPVSPDVLPDGWCRDEEDPGELWCGDCCAE